MKPLEKIKSNGVHYDIAILAVLTILILIPFINKPFHIDDTLFIAGAKQILQSPFNPYGFDINWFGGPTSMWIANVNPPFNSYILAGAIWLFGESEVAIHSVYLGFALLTVLSFYFIAVRFTYTPLMATIFFLSSPVFFVSATNIMADIPLMAFMLLAILFAIKGIEGQKVGMILAASCFTTLAVFTKYIGLAVLPLTVVFWIAKERHLNKRLFLFLFLPILSLIVWHFYSQNLSGQSHLSYASTYTHLVNKDNLFDRTVLQFVSTMIFIGGGIITSVLLIPVFLRRSNIFFKLMVLLFSIIIFIYTKSELSESFLELYALILSIGGLILTFKFLQNLISLKSIEDAFVGIWFVGMLFFIIFLNWTVAGRVILLLLPPTIILLFRKSDKKLIQGKNIGVLLCIVTLTFSLLIAAADYGYSKTYKKAAEDIERFYNVNLRNERQLWFAGHWGFQYYMEKKGFLPFNYFGLNQEVKAGDYVALPLNNTNVHIKPIFTDIYRNRKLTEFVYPNYLHIHSMSQPRKAGFYGNFFGILPFNIGSAPYENIILIELLNLGASPQLE